VVEGVLTHPCPGFAMGKPAMVVVQVQEALSIPVLRLSKRAAPKSSCGKTRHCADGHLVTSHVTVTRIPASGTESCAGHILSCGC